MAGAGVPYALTSRYERILNALSDAASQSNTGFVYSRQSLVPCFRRLGDSIIFDCYLFLRDWRRRPTTSKDKVEIVIHIQETMDGTATSLEKSTVRIGYFNADGGNLAPLHTVHFDYGPNEDLHPTFHAQLSPEPIVIPAEYHEELSCELQFPPPQFRLTCFPWARIPTSDMTLPSVLLCLAADHIGGSFFREFRSQLIEIHREMPLPAFDSLRDSFKASDTHIRSDHWFAHMTDQ